MKLDATREDLKKDIDVVNQELLKKFRLLFVLLLLILLTSSVENFESRKLIPILLIDTSSSGTYHSRSLRIHYLRGQSRIISSLLLMQIHIAHGGIRIVHP